MKGIFSIRILKVVIPQSKLSVSLIESTQLHFQNNENSPYDNFFAISQKKEKKKKKKKEEIPNVEKRKKISLRSGLFSLT